MGPGNTDREGSTGAGRIRMSGDHLDILDPIPISIVITLVPHAVIVSIFLPRVGCQKAVVLKVRGGDRWVSSGLRWPGAALLTSSCSPYLFAVLVVVHAGQRLVRVAVDVRVRSAHVPVPGPAHVTLGQHTGRESVVCTGSPPPHPLPASSPVLTTRS